MAVFLNFAFTVFFYCVEPVHFPTLDSLFFLSFYDTEGLVLFCPSGSPLLLLVLGIEPRPHTCQYSASPRTDFCQAAGLVC